MNKKQMKEIIKKSLIETKIRMKNGSTQVPIC